MIPKSLSKFGLKTAYDYIEKNPERNLPKLMEWVDRLAGDGPDSFPAQREAFRTVINDPDNNMYQLIMNIFREVDKINVGGVKKKEGSKLVSASVYLNGDDLEAVQKLVDLGKDVEFKMVPSESGKKAEQILAENK